jgi:aminoglycoside 3-N-acetyltransferase
MRSSLPVDAVCGQLTALGVRRGAVLVVHTSFRAVGPVDGGPLGLIAALRASLGPDGTLVMPTMTNGEGVFEPTETPTWGMGITAESFWRMRGVIRSTHPGGSFAAAGPDAIRICAPQPLSPPHGADSPPGRAHTLGGQVLLLGVGHSENTTLHVAESIAKVPYSIAHPCVVQSAAGIVERVMIEETDHCCRGFARMDGWLRAAKLQREGRVGHADARLVEAKELVAVALEHLADDPLVFLCGPDAGCEECNEARASTSRPS